ncbi:MAG: PD40 domain-containing protein [Bacteroidia bacterium]|nr:PD40 domain-containing protein [Bacteroidia bacterium]
MNRFLTLIVYSMCCIFTAKTTYAQQSAEDLYKYHNYKEAVKKFIAQASQNKTNPDWNFKVGKCYLEMNGEKKKAIPYLQAAIQNNYKDIEVVKLLGRAYHYDYQFDKAIEQYNKYLLKPKKGEREVVLRLIEMCNNGIELMKNPLDVTFTHLGKEINSEFPDYYPFLPFDESYLLYTTRRVGGIKDADGLYTSDIYISEVKNGIWTKGKTVGSSINTKEDEQCVGLTSDGSKMIVYVEHEKVFGDIFLSTINKKHQFAIADPLPLPINSSALESAASINIEGNVIVFASDRPGGYGGTDIYMSRMLPDSNWSEPQNMGPSINTIYEEDFPQFSEDEKTLYFSSQGHNSMGDFDIFKSTYDDKKAKWQTPKNIGYPVNTTADDMHYAVNKTEREAYISTIREGGFGDYDIWKVIFNTAEAKLTFIKGTVYVNDTLTYATNDVELKIINKATGEIVHKDAFVYKAAKKKFNLALEAGTYIISAEPLGYQKAEKEFTIMDKVDYQQAMFLPLMLKKNSAIIPPLKNIKPTKL